MSPVHDSWAVFIAKRMAGLVVLSLLLVCCPQGVAQSTTNAPLSFNVGIELGDSQADLSVGIRILLIITLLSLAPSILMLMTSFTRIVIVLSFVRNALSLQGAPSNQIIIGLSLFLTFFIMSPTLGRIQSEVLTPYEEKQISQSEALGTAAGLMREFMLSQTRGKDLELFMTMADLEPALPEQLPLNVVIPAFVISELRSAFQMGFLIFIPFILIDLVVATVLMSMGMMMMPPMMVSLPLKLLLFVLVDGWNLVVYSVVQSFST